MIKIMTADEAAREAARGRTESRHDANLRRAEAASKRKHAGRYYRRRRSLPTVADVHEDAQGTTRVELSAPVDALTTRYGFDLSRRKPHGVYYANKIWYRIENAPCTITADGEREDYTHVYAPIADEWLTDLHADQTTEQGRIPVVRIHVVAGRAVKVMSADNGCPFGGTILADETTSAGYLEALLDLGRKKVRKAS